MYNEEEQSTWRQGRTIANGNTERAHNGHTGRRTPSPPVHKGTFAKRYRIIRQLGRGGFGSVYLVEDLLKQREVALKILRKDRVSNAMIRNFKQEFAIMSALKHPNLVRVYDFGQGRLSGEYYITMEYVPSISLHAVSYTHLTLPTN